MSELTDTIGSMVRNTSSMLTAIGIIGVAGWWAFGEKFDNYLIAQQKPILTAVASIQKDVNQLKKEQERNPRPFIEFQGRGLVKQGTKVRPGEIVSVIYSVRRNKLCATTVLVQFYEQSKHRINTSLTTRIEATPAPVSKSFEDFTVDLRIPKNTPPGSYSYRPTLYPEESCGSPRKAPFSDYFEVVAN